MATILNYRDKGAVYILMPLKCMKKHTLIYLVLYLID